MRENGSDMTVQYRALKAAAVVMSLLLMVPGIEVLFKLARASPESVAVAGGLDSHLLMQTGDPYAVLDQIEEIASAGDDEVPESLLAEIGLLSGARDVRIDATGSVLGYVIADDAADVNDHLREHMEQRGWTAVTLSGIEGATFVKASGAYTWALATCTQVGQLTSVVVRCIDS